MVLAISPRRPREAIFTCSTWESFGSLFFVSDMLIELVVSPCFFKEILMLLYDKLKGLGGFYG